MRREDISLRVPSSSTRKNVAPAQNLSLRLPGEPSRERGRDSRRPVVRTAWRSGVYASAQAELLHDGDEPAVVAQRIESRIDFEVNQLERAIV